MYYLLYVSPLGRGTCNCTTGMCMCSANYTGERSGRPFFGSKCECNPDFCYNENYPDVCVYVYIEFTVGCKCRIYRYSHIRYQNCARFYTIASAHLI